nr:hypothetical protein [Tanacetum cinerariifolium]
MEKEEEEIIKSINETPAQKVAKRRRLREQPKEDEDLKKQLEAVVDEYDKLLTSYGVHIITFTTTMFALLVEKKYPLSRFTLE